MATVFAEDMGSVTTVEHGDVNSDSGPSIPRDGQRFWAWVPPNSVQAFEIVTL